MKNIKKEFKIYLKILFLMMITLVMQLDGIVMYKHHSNMLIMGQHLGHNGWSV